MVQGLRLRASNPGCVGSTLVRELRSHRPPQSGSNSKKIRQEETCGRKEQRERDQSTG